MGNELVAIYFIYGIKYSIYGCWDNDTSENAFDFYDVFLSDGSCINEGVPFWTMPSRDNVEEFISVNKN